MHYWQFCCYSLWFVRNNSPTGGSFKAESEFTQLFTFQILPAFVRACRSWSACKMLIKVMWWLKVSLSFSSRAGAWHTGYIYFPLVTRDGLTLASNLPAALLHPPTAGMWERIGKAKARKLVAQEKDSLVNEEKNEKGNHHRSPTGSCPGSVWAMTALEGFPPQLYCWARHMACNNLLDNLCQLFQPCLLPASCLTPAFAGG